MFAEKPENGHLRGMGGQHFLPDQGLVLIEGDHRILFALLTEALRHQPIFALVVEGHLHHHGRPEAALLHVLAGQRHRAGAGVVIEMPALVGMGEDCLHALGFEKRRQGGHDGRQMAKGLLIADGKGVPACGWHLGEVQHPRQFPRPRPRIVSRAAKPCGLDAAQIARGAIGDMDRMGAAQQFQQRPKADGFVIGMGHHERDRRIHSAPGAEIAQDGLSLSGAAAKHGLTNGRGLGTICGNAAARALVPRAATGVSGGLIGLAHEIAHGPKADGDHRLPRPIAHDEPRAGLAGGAGEIDDVVPEGLAIRDLHIAQLVDHDRSRRDLKRIARHRLTTPMAQIGRGQRAAAELVPDGFGTDWGLRH